MIDAAPIAACFANALPTALAAFDGQGLLVGGWRLEPVVHPGWLLVGGAVGAWLLARSLAPGAKPWLNFGNRDTATPFRGRMAKAKWLFLLRAMVGIVLGFILLNPQKQVPLGHTTPPPVPRRMTVLVDQTLSMQIPDAPGKGDVSVTQTNPPSGGTTRWQQVISVFDSPFWNGLNRTWQTDLHGFDVGLGESAGWPLGDWPQPQAPATDLVQAARQALVGSGPEDALFIVSDGRNTTAEQPEANAVALNLLAAEANAAGVAIHVWPVGKPLVQPNRMLTTHLPRTAFFENEPVTLSVRVDDIALAASGGTVTATTPDGQVVATAELPAPAPAPGSASETAPGNAPGTTPGSASENTDGSPRRVRLSWPAEPGLWGGQGMSGASTGASESVAGVIVSVTAADGETQLADNQQAVFYEVTQKPARVLVLAGAPTWQMRFWVDALRNDRRLALTRVTQINEARRLVSHPEGLPEPEPDPTDHLDTVDGYAAFDLVMLGRQVDTMLTDTEWDAMRTWVAERGGKIMLATEMTPALTAAMGDLAPTLADPVDANPITSAMFFTASGREHPVLGLWHAGNSWQNMPDVRVRPSQPRPATTVWAQVEGQPALVGMPFGQGTVAAALTDSLWRWYLLPPEESGAAIRGGQGGPGESVPASAPLPGAGVADWVKLMVLGEVGLGDDVAMSASPWRQHVGGVVNVGLQARRVTETLGLHGVQVVGPLPLPGQMVSGAAASGHWDVTTDQGLTAGLPMRPVAGSRLQLSGVFSPNWPGLYRLEAIGPGGQRTGWLPVVVEQADRETLWTDADPDALKRLAEQTGGVVLDPENPMAFVDALAQRQDLLAPVAAPEPIWIPAWPLGWLLAWLVLLLGSEWLLRRHLGLT